MGNLITMHSMNNVTILVGEGFATYCCQNYLGFLEFHSKQVFIVSSTGHLLTAISYTILAI